jgi:hypothetical protein
MHEPLLKTVDILTIAALILGPILAVQVQKFIETTRDAKNRRVWIFKTLMASRGAILSADHVAALNRIDLEFSDKDKFHRVIEAWKLYFDNLCIRTTTEAETVAWVNRNDDLLADLLFEMGHSLGYKFDRSLIKRNIYTPDAHGRIERENQTIRERLLDVFEGRAALPINVAEVGFNDEAKKKQDELQAKQAQLSDLMIEHYTRENEKAKQNSHPLFETQSKVKGK